MPQVFSRWQGFPNIEQQVKVVRHDCCLPHFYLGVQTGYLGQFLFKNCTAKRAEYYMGKVCRATFGFYIAFQMSKQRVAPIYAQGDHIKTTIPIVLPLRTTMLVVLNVMRL